MNRDVDIELVVLDSDHFLDIYRDVVDLEHSDTPDIDTSDLGEVMDMNVALKGLSVRPLTDWMHARAGSHDFHVTNDVIPVSLDVQERVYETPPVLWELGTEYPEPQIESFVDLEPGIELMVVDSDHFLERYQDIFDTEYPTTPDIADGEIVDFANPMAGLATKPLTHFLDTFKGDGSGVVAGHGEYPDGFSLDEREYETPPRLTTLSAGHGEPEIEAMYMTPEIEEA